jgi:thiamine pyrophosphokinase
MISKPYLLVVNSAWLPSSIIREVAANAIIVALDGAANGLAALGIMPDIILGDFDSIEEMAEVWGIKKGFSELTNEDKPYAGNFGTFIVPAKDQNFTDFQKALKFIKYDAQHYNFPVPSMIHIATSSGLRTDHELSHIFTLQKEYSSDCPIYLHREYQSLQYVSNTTVCMQGKHHDYCGIFGMPNATMSVKKGKLEYGDVTPYELSFIQHSSSNRIIGDEDAYVEIEGDALIVHPPFFSAQRTFFNKSRPEQLLALLQDAKRKLYVGTAAECDRVIKQWGQVGDILCLSHDISKLSQIDKEEKVLLSLDHNIGAISENSGRDIVG